MNPIVSVIMPVYNSVSYLPKSIQCILEQSFTEWELILIDDGSVDGSSKICDEYVEMDARIQVIHQANQGMCAARNTAIHLAKGKYIAFMDDDDSCKKDLLEKSYRAAELYQADLVKFGREAIIIDKEERIYERQERKLDFVQYDKKEIQENFISLRKRGVFSPVWDGLYRRELLLKKNILFNENLRYGEEDTIFCMQFVSEAKKLVLIPGVYYIHYIRLSHSASAKITDKALEKYFVSLNEMKKVMNKLNIDYIHNVDFFDCFLQCYIIEFILKLNYKKTSLSEKKKWIKQLDNQIQFDWDICFVSRIFGVCGKRSVVGLLWLTKNYTVLYYLIKCYFHKKIKLMKN